MRLRRFLMTEPTTTLAHDWIDSVRGVRAHTTYVGQDYPPDRGRCNPGYRRPNYADSLIPTYESRR